MTKRKKTDRAVGKHSGNDVGRGMTGGEANLRARVGGGRTSWGADERGRLLSQRAHYLGQTTRAEATAQALLAAVRLAAQANLEAPTFHVDDHALASALGGGPSPDDAVTITELREVLAHIPNYKI